MTAEERDANRPSGTDERAVTPHRRNLKRRAIIIGSALVVLLIIYLFASAFLPRWWAHRVGDQINGSFASGVLWGLFYGIIFTALSLLVLRQAFRRRWQWRTRAAIILAALIVAAPNLMTLSVVFGQSSAAHAGQRIMDVEAPAFRWATLFGALGGAAGAVAVQYLASSRRRRAREVSRLRTEIKRRDAESAPADPDER